MSDFNQNKYIYINKTYKPGNRIVLKGNSYFPKYLLRTHV